MSRAEIVDGEERDAEELVLQIPLTASEPVHDRRPSPHLRPLSSAPHRISRGLGQMGLARPLHPEER